MELFLKIISMLSDAYRRRFSVRPKGLTLYGPSKDSRPMRCPTVWLRESPDSNNCSESRSFSSMEPSGLTSPSSSAGPTSMGSGELLRGALQLTDSTSLGPK